MSSTDSNKKKIKDLTVEEFKNLIKESIAEDIESWKDTFEIIADQTLMRQIMSAEKARTEGRRNDFIPWEKVKRNV